MVALLLQRAGFADEVIAAAALHDVAEDAGVTIAELRREFGPRVAELVEHMTEQKLDGAGRERPW
jgi:(p)ppGpp synthase/HD superfamily hydrolase